MKSNSSFHADLFILLPVAFLAASTLSGDQQAPRLRRFEATYVATVGALPDGAKSIEVWLPLPSDTPHQKIGDVSIDAPPPVTIGKDSAGNSVARFVVSPPPGSKLTDTTYRVRFRVERREVLKADLAAENGPKSPGTADAALEPYLGANRLVPLTPRVRELAKKLASGSADPLEKARKFYEYLVDNGTYDKTTPGWGKGDSERFCDVKKGNCTDFHSLFLALCRAEGIPARFRIGFPVKPEKEGTIPGYHCWAEFFVAGRGWIPVDASDAAKSGDPAKKRYLFGNLDPDRFEISGGRDLVLSPPQKDAPLNFFIYPYVEVDGKAFTETKIRLEYKDL